MQRARADGTAGERRAAALFGIAACAEISGATLNEESAKVDLKVSMRDAFQTSRLITLHLQVKSGASYEATSSDALSIKLNLDQSTLNSLTDISMPSVIAWVPPHAVTNKIYWYVKNPRRPSRTPIAIRRHQFVRPGIAYEISRLYAQALWIGSRPRQTVALADKSVALSRAKLSYARLKTMQWHHPLVGRLLVTRLAWRHVTRRSKTKARRLQALRLTPYLKSFLGSAPDRFVTDHSSITTSKRRTVETRFVRCWYRHALSIDGLKRTVVIRIKEQASYPTKWQDQPLGSGDIKQVATLASWWCTKGT